MIIELICYFESYSFLYQAQFNFIQIQTISYSFVRSFVRSFELERKHFCGEILNQYSDAREVQTTRDSIEERWDILLRERLVVFSAASKESDFIMEQVLLKVNMGLITFGYL